MEATSPGTEEVLLQPEERCKAEECSLQGCAQWCLGHRCCGCCPPVAGKAHWLPTKECQLCTTGLRPPRPWGEPLRLNASMRLCSGLPPGRYSGVPASSCSARPPAVWGVDDQQKSTGEKRQRKAGMERGRQERRRRNWEQALAASCCQRGPTRLGK